MSMALSSWLASLKVDVTAVTPVQANFHAGLRCNGIDAADVTGVTYTGGNAAVETSVTAAENQTLQPEPAQALGSTPVTVVTAEKINADSQVTEAAATPTQTEPRRRFRPRERWLTHSEQLAATAYYAHHFSCLTCIAAGRGDCYGKRCELGLALWSEYDGADNR